MAQYILSVTIGEPNHSSWWLMDNCDYTHMNRIFDDFDAARRALRESITQFFADHRNIEDLEGAQVFDSSGQLEFPMNWRPEDDDTQDYDCVLAMVNRILADPEARFASEIIPLVSTAPDTLDGDGCQGGMHCDKDMILICGVDPNYSLKLNVHNMEDEQKYYWFSFRICYEYADDGPELLNVSLCPLSDQGVKDTRFPGEEYLDQLIETIEKDSLNLIP